MKNKLALGLATFFLGLHFEQIAQCDREQMVIDYNTNYLGSMVSDSELAWTGSVSNCNPGTISNLSNTRVLQRINYYRHLVGLPNATSIDPVASVNCQAAALMMDANNSLSHSPPTSWLCYSLAGAQGASNSNLALGSPSCHSSYSIDLYMRDNGVASLGHRRWVIKPNSLTFGHGSTTTASALFVFGPSGAYPNVPFTAYPSPGFFPAPLANMQVWSFSIPGADFSNSTVSMTSAAGTPITLTYAALPNGYGENAIGFTPAGIVNNSPYDQKYTVQINNVSLQGGTTQNYTYDVTVAPVVFPPQCPGGQSWSTIQCACTGAVGISETEENLISLFPNPANGEITISTEEKFINEDYSIVDASGRIVISGKLYAIQTSIDIQELPDGIYYFHLNTNRSAGIKLIKN